MRRSNYSQEPRSRGYNQDERTGGLDQSGRAWNILVWEFGRLRGGKVTGGGWTSGSQTVATEK